MKKLLSLLLALVCILSLAVSALAAEYPVVVVECDAAGGAVGAGVLRFSYLTSVSAQISRSGGKVTCSGTMSIYADKDVLFTLELQQSPKNADDWTTLKDWSIRVTTTGVSDLEKSYYVNSGYDYRCVATATVLGTNDRPLEAGLAHSSSITY